MHTEPWAFYGSEGEQRNTPMGIVVEANQAIAKESGLILEPVLEPYGRIGRHLRNGDCDLTYLIRSPDRDDYVEYVGHLFTFQCIVVARPSLPLRRYEDLAGLRIGLIKDIHLNPRFDEDAQLQKVEVKDYETLVDMFLNGRLDAIAGNSVSIPYLLQKRGHVSLAQHPLVLQQTEDRQLFSLTGAHPRERSFQSRQAVAEWLQGFSDKISYNIEDLDYLTGSLDLAGLGLALELGRQGYNMVMEVVANNPQKPQKGGMLAWDPQLARDVMVESFQLGNIANREIHYLNRNFNHYPQPLMSWQRLGESGLPMPIAVKEGSLYFQPVQGDINFLVQTAFFRRRELRPIRSLKSPASLPLAVNRMLAQDRQPGFREFVQRISQRSP